MDDTSRLDWVLDMLMSDDCSMADERTEALAEQLEQGFRGREALDRAIIFLKLEKA